jgi:hypothetical protein
LSEEKDYPTKGWSVESRLPLKLLFGGKKPRQAVLDAFDLLNPKEQITVDLAVFYIIRDRRAKYNPRLTTFERSFALNNAICWIARHHGNVLIRDLRQPAMFAFLTVRFPRESLESQAK